MPTPSRNRPGCRCSTRWKDAATLSASSEPDKAGAAVRRLRTHISDLAISEDGGILVVTALGNLGDALMVEALSLPDPASDFTVGPFEGREHHPSAGWWSHHEVQLSMLAIERTAGSGAVAAVRVLKAT